MKNIQIILIIAILILIYLITMQWLGDKNTTTNNDKIIITPTPITQIPSTVMPENSVPTDVNGQPIVPLTPPERQLPPTPPVVVETPTVTPPPTTTPTADSTTPFDVTKLIEYKNASFGYHFFIPKKVYYAGFGAKDGAVHTVAIRAEAVPETFEDSTTRVLYYGKKVLPELKGTTRYVDPNGKYILLLIDGQYSVRIESDNLKSATVQAIEGTIGVN